MFDYLKKRSFDNDKRGQVTIFIILAVLVVAGIVLLIVLTGDSDDSQGISGDQGIQGPSAFLESCSEREIFSYLRDLRLQGGYLNPQSKINSSRVDGINRDVAYLCYSNTLDKECTPQQGALVGHMERQLENASERVIEDCFSNMINSYEEKGYEVSGGSFNAEDDMSVDLVPGRYVINLNYSSITLEKTNETIKLESGSELVYSSELYELGQVANYLVREESKYRNYRPEQFASFYASYEVIRNETLKTSEIYTISKFDSDREFRFGIRELN